MQANVKGDKFEWNVVSHETGLHTSRSLQDRGWEGTYYIGTRTAKDGSGRTFTMMLVRNAKTGEFQKAL